MKDNRIKRKLYETHTIRYNEYRQINAYIRQWIDNGKEIKIILKAKGQRNMYKNIEKKTKLLLKDQVEYQEGQVVSKTLVQNDYVSVTVFSFDKGEEISTHASGGDAMVTVLDGTGRFTVGGEIFILTEGETLIMPKDVPHAVYGEEQFKMLLTVSF